MIQHLKLNNVGIFLVVQWLRLHAPEAGSLGLIPGQGTRSHIPQLSSDAALKSLQVTATYPACQLKILHAATKKNPQAASYN